MKIQERIRAFVELGSFLEQFINCKQKPEFHSLNKQYYQGFTELSGRVSYENLWFTPKHVQASIKGICFFLQKSNIDKWLKNYNLSKENTNIRVAVIMAGNIPMVGFHDILSVLIAGHIFIGKLSARDNQLLNFIAKLLISLNPKFEKLISFHTGQLNSCERIDAIIATGSNNSARYFDDYFSKYPNIIRRNRNSVAVISGNESEKEIKALGEDIFLYFGLGCRNVSKLYIPENYNITKLFKSWESYQSIIDHSKYANNYNYQRSLFLMNKIQHFDNGFLLLRENTATASPVGVVYFEFYSELQDVKQKLKTDSEMIQCIVASDLENAIPFGKAQEPQLWDYADNVDTMQFLTSL